ncbi:hypothetical protein MTO96_006079 [Rhipicephalus appendiculatus]
MQLNHLAIWTAAIVAATVQAEPTRWAWAAVERRLNRLLIHDGEPPQASSFTEAPHVPVAWGSFKDDINESGWSYLQIESSPYVHDELQAYAAGALEAYLTRRLMENQWENLFSRYCENQTDYCNRLDDFIIKNLRYSREQEHRFKYSDPYWNMILDDTGVSQVEDPDGFLEEWKTAMEAPVQTAPLSMELRPHSFRPFDPRSVITASDIKYALPARNSASGPRWFLGETAPHSSHDHPSGAY